MEIIINDEKTKETQRQNKYENETNENKKAQIQKQNQNERNKGQLKIEEFTNSIDIKVKTYEERLRNSS